jgi:hypothetical protein
MMVANAVQDGDRQGGTLAARASDDPGDDGRGSVLRR